MSQAPPETTGLKSQYAAQLASDLERNAKEQERVGAEVAALQQQLRTLQHDHVLLVNMQQALSTESTETVPKTEAADTASVPVPRQAPTTLRARTPKKSTAKSKRAAAAGGAIASTAAPTLGELIRDHLAQQTEPRSAAEVTAALARTHPERNAKDKVVRVTLEGLVAKSYVQRTKQGKSVFYSAAGASPAAAPAAPGEPADGAAAESAQETNA